VEIATTGAGILNENLTPAFAVDAPAAANPTTARAKINFFIQPFIFGLFGR